MLTCCRRIRGGNPYQGGSFMASHWKQIWRMGLLDHKPGSRIERVVALPFSRKVPRSGGSWSTTILPPAAALSFLRRENSLFLMLFPGRVWLGEAIVALNRDLGCPLDTFISSLHKLRKISHLASGHSIRSDLRCNNQCTFLHLTLP
jgi:hypothetical protein